MSGDAPRPGKTRAIPAEVQRGLSFFVNEKLIAKLMTLVKR